MKIEIKHKNVYGNDQMYVCNPIVKEAISDLTGTKTLLPRHVEALKALGHEVIDLDKVLEAMFN
jgi:hypothetical protein